MSRRMAGRAACAFALVSLFVFSALVARGVGEPPTTGTVKPDTLVAKTTETATELALASPATLELKETPLKHVADVISSAYKINILFDRKAIVDRGIALDSPFTVSWKDATLGPALRRMLAAKGLDYLVPEDVGNVLMITTAEIAKDHLVVRAYDVRDFARPANELSSKLGSEYDELVSLLTAVVAPTTWDSAGGAGSINRLADTLVICQTTEAHERIATLLATLKTAKEQQEVKLGGGAIDVNTSAEAAIRRQLANRVDVHFDGAPLEDVVKWLRGRGIEAQLLPISLAESDVFADTRVSFSAKNVQLALALKQMLSDLDAGYYIENDVLVFASAELASLQLSIKVYPVGDVIDAVMNDPRADLDCAFDQLIDAICTTVSPISWDSTGGAGNIIRSAAAKSLVILQADREHEEVGRILAKIRATLKPGKRLAGDRPSSTTRGAATVVRMYPLVENGKDADRLADKYVAAVKAFVDSTDWADKHVAIQAFSDRIVVRQTPEVQRRVKNLLEMLGAVKMPAPANEPAPQPLKGIDVIDPFRAPESAKPPAVSPSGGAPTAKPAEAAAKSPPPK